MLNFVYGRAATGKTTEILSMIEKKVKNGNEVVFIVPEQFTFESERSVLSLLGDKLSHKVTVLSFTALAETLTRICGGSARGVLSDADKILFMNRTLLALKDELLIWRRYLSAPGFASKVVDMIGELKISAIFPEDLEKVADKLNGTALKEKIKALALVYRAYDAALSNKFIDPADKLDKLYNDLLHNDFFKNKSVFIDGFKGFTGQQYRVIDVIVSTAESVTVALLCDTLEKTDELNIFSNTVDVAERMKDIALRHKIPIGEKIHLENPHYETEAMRKVESILSGNLYADGKESEYVNFCVAKTPADEVAFAARNIRRLTREENYRYKDFVIIARNPELYENAIEREFLSHDISCFFDKRIPLIISPLYAFIDSALTCVKSFDSNEIFRYIKTGLSVNLGDDEINELENYVFLWDINRFAWEQNWDMDPTGFSETKADKEKEIAETLSRLNGMRSKVIEPVIKLRNEFGETVKEKATAIVNLLNRCETSKKMSVLLSEVSNSFSPEDIDALRQSWDCIMNVLDGMVRCFGDDTVSEEQFMDMFRISCETTTVGRIPQMLDEVTFGAADRIRPSRPKVAFILGAKQGVFPKLPENSSLLGNSDRRILIDNGLEIRNKTIFQTVEESQLVYASLCCPSERLFISYSQVDSSGSSGEPSGFFTLLKDSLSSEKCFFEPSEMLEESNLPETEETAFRVLCSLGSNDKAAADTLKGALFDNKGIEERYERMKNVSVTAEQKLSEETAKKFFGDDIRLSATSFDVFHACHFRYFCKYALNTGIIQPAKLNVMQRGTIIHYVIEQFCNAHMKDIATVTKEQIEEETDKYIKEYFSKVRGSNFILNARIKFLVDKIAEGTVEVLERIVADFAQSGFRPERCEVSINTKEKNGIIPVVEFPFGTNSKFSFTGSIDRLDTFNSYVRIVDYKTGTKNFSMKDTLYGLNLQMLLYLYCVIRGNNPDYKGKKPAGILYFPSKKDLKKEGLIMNGLINDAEIVREAMEKENQGKHVPVYKLTKDNKPYKNNSSHISERAFGVIFDFIEKKAAEMGETLHRGDISVNPVGNNENDNACKYCDYKSVCGLENEKWRKIESKNNETVLLEMEGGSSNEV